MLSAEFAVTPRQLLDHVQRSDPRQYSPLEQPAVLLLLDSDRPDDGDRALLTALLAQCPCPVIGIGRAADEVLAAACDARVATCDEADLLMKNCQRAPMAAMALVQVLRITSSLPLHDALVVESLAYATLQGGAEHRAWLAARAPRPGSFEDQSSPLSLQRDGDQLLIELSRPARRNAINVALRDALVEALQLVTVDDSIQRVLLRGAGKCFSIGGELDEFGSVADTALAHTLRSIQLPAHWLARCGERVEARLHSACIGAGIEIPAFAARVVAAPTAFFQLPELSMGLIPGAGGCVSIPRRIGRQRTAWLVLSGKRINADTALDWGLVDEIG